MGPESVMTGPAPCCGYPETEPEAQDMTSRTLTDRAPGALRGVMDAALGVIHEARSGDRERRQAETMRLLIEACGGNTDDQRRFVTAWRRRPGEAALSWSGLIKWQTASLRPVIQVGLAGGPRVNASGFKAKRLSAGSASGCAV